MLNALSGADILAEDKLFATLDPTTRRVKLPSGSEALFTDTVGFIQKLPTELVAAFRATLEEITEADVLLHVLDASHMNVRDQARAVEETLEEIGASDKPMVVALNKVDKITRGNREITLPIEGEIPRSARNDSKWLVTQDEFLREGNAVRISALKGQGLDELLGLIERALAEEMVELRVRIPYNQGELAALFHQRGIIESEKFAPKGTVIVGKIAARLVERFEEYKI